MKDDLLAMFRDLQPGSLDLYRLNFAMITLIPKEADARTTQKFRPISLLNYSFKIFSKVFTNRLTRIIARLIYLSQTDLSLIVWSLPSAH